MTGPHIDFYHWPRSRSAVAHALLEELDANYETHLVNIETGAQHEPDYLAVNPMAKVPAVVHNGALIAEMPAIFIYLGDLYPEAGLTPPLEDPLRGPYLRWLVFYGSCFEPALLDRSLQREPAPRVRSGYGDFESVVNTITGQLQQGTYLLGDRFTVADVLWGRALHWAIGFNLLADQPLFRAYVDRVMNRPAIQRALARDSAPDAGLVTA